MAASIQIKRGTTAKVAAYKPLEGELVLDLTTRKLYAGDGSTAGGNLIIASKAGITDASGPVSGEVGEFLSATGTASLTNATKTDVISLSIPAGDWDVSGLILFNPSNATATAAYAGLSKTSATLPDFPEYVAMRYSSAYEVSSPVPEIRLNTSSAINIILVAYSEFSGGTMSAKAFIRARRAR